MIKKVVLTLLAGAFVAVVAGSAFADCWVAMALNQKKKTYSIATGSTLPMAQKSAMNKAGMPGASIWTWRHGGFLALAVDPNDPGTYGMAGGSTQAEAEMEATKWCQRNGRSCRIVSFGGCGNDSWKETTDMVPPQPPKPVHLPKGQLITSHTSE